MIQRRLATEPELEYLSAFLRNPRMGNDASRHQGGTARDLVVLERVYNIWQNRSWPIEGQPWQSHQSADAYAVIANYLDPDIIRVLADTFEIDAKVFRTHINGCEQHYRGDWAPSSMTSAPYLRTETRECRSISISYRRPYRVIDGLSFSAFDESRMERCSLLRSHHRARSAGVLFEHERCTIAWGSVSDRKACSRSIRFCIYLHDLTQTYRGNHCTL